LPESESESASPYDETMECPECNSRRIFRDYARGELVCSKCGLVIDDDYIDTGAEWRSFSSEQREKRERTGAPMNPMLHDKGLTTEISWKNRDASGGAIPAKSRAQLYRMRKWQRRIRVNNATERNLVFALGELEKVAAHLSLPRYIREHAANIYRESIKKNLIRGRSIESVVAAALYASCRENGVPRTLDEIADASNVHRKIIGRTYRFLMRELHMSLQPTSPHDYVSRFCSELNLDREVELTVKKLLDQATDTDLTSGRGPTGVAAAAIYIASILCNQRRTQKEVADVAGVTEVTIRNRYKELKDKLNLDV
jgi:transcription initiation factor TFIIB